MELKKIEFNKVTWYSITLAVALFVGTFLLAFYLGYVVGLVRKPENKVALTANTLNQNVGWKTYNNEEGYFSFQYPPNWELLFSLVEGEYKTVHATEGPFGKVEVVVNWGQGFGGACSDGNYEDVMVGSETFHACHDMYPSAEGWRMMGKDIRGTSIDISATSDKTSEGKEIVFKILKSIQFTK